MTSENNKSRRIRELFEHSVEVKRQSSAALADAIAQAACDMAAALAAGNKIMSCGNGGSAADAQHFASEMVNRFNRDRHAMAAIALTTDSSNLTSIANDCGYEYVFSRQIEALGRRGDRLLAISTSGASANINAAIRQAQKQGIKTLALSGRDGGTMADLLRDDDIELRVPADNTARIQETHLLIIHCLCDLLEQDIAHG